MQSHPVRRVLVVGLVLSLLLTLVGSKSGTQAQATTGPGLPKLTFTSSELFRPISTLVTTTASGERRGHGLVTMHNGYLAVPYGRDSGQSGGGFAFYDVSNPRAPALVSRFDVPSLRESHGFARSSSYPGDYVVLQAGTGIEFWNWTDVRNPVLLSRMSLPGVQFSDYDVGAWWLAWQAPFVYVAASGNGIFIVDATNPSAPTLVKQIPISQTGGFRINPIFVIGNLLVASSVDFFGTTSTGILTMDISDPRNPVVIKTQSAGIPIFYSSFFSGNKLIGLGNNDHSMHVWDLSNPAVFTKIGAIAGMDRPVYATVQDGHAFVGDETSFTKVDMRTNTFSIVGKGTSGLGDRSEDIITPLGNIGFVANDHGTGSSLIPHQLAPDNTGPAVTMVNPPNGAVSQKLSSRVGITLSDWVNLKSVNTTSFIVRPVGGSALSGKYSGEQGILNFWPDQPLLANTTYEVVIPAGGIKDFSGNGVPTAFTSRFSTGTSISPVSVTARVNGPATVGATVGFAITASSGSGTLSYSWDFGDGSAPTAFSTTSGASKVYSAPGHYPVKVTVRDGGGQTSSSSFTQTIHHPVTGTKPSASSTIILDGARGRVWAVNPDTDTVTAINAGTHAKVLEVAVGKQPRTLAQAPDGTIWVANQGDSSLSVLNPDTGALVQTIVLPAGSRPYGVAFSPNGSAAYVSTEGTRQLLKLSPSTRATVGTLTLGGPLRGIAVSADSSRVFVTRFISPADRGEVVEVGGSTHALVRTMPLAFDPGPDGNTTGRGVPNYLSSITISPDGRQARVPSKKDNTARGSFRDGQPLNFESTVRTIVSYLDLTTSAETLSRRFDLNDRDMADAVAYSALGDYIFVATQGTNSVEVFDAYNNRLMTGMPGVGRAPQGLVLSADGKKLFVQNFMSRSVAVYDVSGIVASTSNTFSRLATVSTVATEKLSAQVLRGKQLFYNADDRRMNLDGYIACASCHLDGDSDGRVWDFTDRGEGLRNTVDLRGKRGLGQGNVHWTGNFDEIQDFEHDIRSAFGGLGFMHDADFNSGGRNTPLGGTKTGYSADLDALAAYVTSLSTVNRSPFRNADGTLTAGAQSGRALFKTYCASCHGGADFTDSRAGFLHDVGTIKPSSGRRLGGTLAGFDTPALTGIWETPPYLHDGSAATLRDVLLNGQSTGRHGAIASLTSAQLDQLVSYLQQIDGLEAASPPSRLYVATLSGAQETPAVSTPARGIAKVVLLDDGVSARVSLQFSGLGSAQTSAHIHGPGGPGVSAPAIITLPNGQVSDFAVTLTAQQATDLRNGQLYVNVHSASFPNGEIRGQLTDASLPPPSPPLPPIVNLALNRPASADSTEGGRTPAHGNDGNTTTTRWTAADAGLNHWWQVDLGANYNLTGSEVMWEFSGRVYQYRVEVSGDGASWQLVANKTSNTSTAQTQSDAFSAPGRYVRITLTGLPAQSWAGFWEFRVFGRGTAATTPVPGSTATRTPTSGGISPSATRTRTPTSGGTTPSATRTPTPGGVTYNTIVARHSAKAVDGTGGAAAQGAAVVQYALNGGTNQQWQFRDMGGGYYQVVNRASGLCMDVTGASPNDNALIVQWTCGTGTNQQWQLQDAGGGYYRLVARHSGKCLDVPGGNTADNVQLVQWTCGTGTNQQFQRL